MAPHPEALVSTEWLAAHLADPALTLLDASFKLPGMTPTADEDYASAHIPGAVYFDIDAVSDHANPLPHMLPSPQEFARMAGKLGIGDGQKIVIYDTAGTAATRVWWMLRIDGPSRRGGARWRLARNGAPRAGRSPPTCRRPAERRFTPHFDAGPGARPGAACRQSQGQARAGGRCALRRALCRQRARAAAGPARRPHPRRRQPALRTTDRSQDRRDAAARRARGAAAPGRACAETPVVASCGSGVSACVVAFAMHLAGWPDAAVYDGSWSEWGLPAARRPIATGAVND